MRIANIANIDWSVSLWLKSRWVDRQQALLPLQPSTGAILMITIDFVVRIYSRVTVRK